MVVPTPRVYPNCPKCEGKTFSSENSTFKKTKAIIVYCTSCGAILGILPVIEKK